MRRFLSLLVLLVIATLGIGCTKRERQWPNEVPYRLRHSPPTSKDIIEALMASARVELVDSTCRGAGTDRDIGDRTVGQYISAILAELDDPEAINSILSVTDYDRPERTAWKGHVMIRHSKGQDVWAWGIEFMIRKSDGQVDLQSFRCVGGG